MHLEERQLAIQILTPCTLRCRLCADYSPLYMERKEHYYVTYKNFCLELDRVFHIYDYIYDLTITGGEPLLHPQLGEIVRYTLEHHTKNFQTCRIFSNGTILPTPKLLTIIQRYSKSNFEWVLDNYGEISRKAEETIFMLKEYDIPYRVNQYYGDAQHCGGWIDYGPLDQFRNYSSEQAQKIVEHCHSATWKNLLEFKGKLFLCTQSAFGFDMGFFQLNPGEYIDLFDNKTPIECKKEIAARFGQKYINACQYCNGFDAENSKRYPAGEQI